MAEAGEKPPEPMDIDTFEAWYAAQPDSARYELHDGIAVRMQSERVRHARAKLEVARQFANQIEAQGLPCDVFADGMAVPLSDSNWFEPDCLLRCGPPLDGDATRIHDPMIVVEVSSPSNAGQDVNRKALFYMAHPTVQHYVIIHPAEKRVMVHSRRGEEWITRLVASGEIALDPPGLNLDIDALFAERS